MMEMTNENIIKALVAVQKEISNPVNSASNPFFKSKYAPLNEILDLVRPILADNGLFMLQDTGTEILLNENGGNDEKLYIQTKIFHTSGECLESDKLVLNPDKKGVQGMGGAITYGRRYQLSAMLGITGEDDNDGNGSTKPVQNKAINKSKSKAKPKPPKKPSEEEVVNDIVNEEIKKTVKKKPKVPANY